MAATTRQTNLLIQQDWTKIYQTFQNADFESYDFETLRQSMISYLRSYYPEDFNDFLESSEYVALIDLIAFLGQSLAFRTDLNARENFLDTAQRRDSVLKLARLISYNPSRNINSSGLVKFDSVSTTEDIIDSTGLNLTGISVFWNDITNGNWAEQFALIINAALVNSQMVGKPGHTATIFGVRTEEYSVNLLAGIVPTFQFNELIEGTQMDFEMVSATSAKETYIYEKTPKPSQTFNILYRNDNLGNNSNNTGWFMFFKQGTLATLDFTLSDSLPNRVVSVNVNNINNNDVWVFQLDANGNPSTQWTIVESVSGYNVIYNTTTLRTIVQVNTRANDQIDLVFGDGSFADIPIGTFRVYYRTGNGLQYNITPAEMQGVSIPITYVGRNGRTEVLTIKASLQNNVNNSTPRETLDNIKTKAPQQYYTQNRMITGEDYNTLPFTMFSDILKIKVTNRSSSGVSRYLDVLDVTGKYSSTNIFCDDGVIYEQETIQLKTYSPPNNGDIAGSLNQVINNELFVNNLVPFNQFVYNYFTRFTTTDIKTNGTIFYVAWTQLTIGTNQSTGFLATTANYTSAKQNGTYAIPLQVGASSSTSMHYVTPGAIIKFRAAVSNSVTPYHFDSMNNIIAGEPSLPGDRNYIYATVVSVNGDGTNGGIISANSPGPIVLSAFIPNGAIIDQVIPKFYNSIPSRVLLTAATLVNGQKNFGLRFDQVGQTWSVIQPQDLKLTQTNSTLVVTGSVNAEWSDSYAGDTSASGLDSSWVLSFVSTSTGYNIYYRQLNYIFESEKETTFYFDPKVRVYDSKTGNTITDQIKVLKSNSDPDTAGSLYDDKTMFILSMITDPDGYQNVNKILLQYPDSNRDGIPDNPDLFTEIVNPLVNSVNKNVYFQQVYTTTDSYVQYQVLPAGAVESAFGSQADIVNVFTQYNNGQVFYAYAENLFYTLNVVTSLGVTTRSLSAPIANGTQYLWYPGRQSLYFQYRHAASSNRRIDPSPNNILDLYIITSQYANSYQSWIQDTTGTVVEPTAPTTDQLESAYSKLEDYKAMSDTLIYSSGKFKPLFGSKADPSLQATFKVVKNANIVISDNDVRSAVVAAINNFFSIANWDFGETFYFSELSAYLHQVLVPNISSIIIVPTSTGQSFGNLYQINAEPNEIVISAATVENVQIISSITSANLS